MTLRVAAQTRPNIVLIVADDLGYGDLGSYGAPDIKTPNLDRLAREGVRLTDFYANAPVCTPTRAGLMSGRYQQRVRLERPIETNAATPATGLDIGLPATGRSLPQLLKNAGYATGLIGKWHWASSRSSSRIATASTTSGAIWPATSIGTRTCAATGSPICGRTRPQFSTRATSDHELTKRAVTFIGEHASRPFFLKSRTARRTGPSSLRIAPRRPWFGMARCCRCRPTRIPRAARTMRRWSRIWTPASAASSTRSRPAGSRGTRWSSSRATTAASGCRATRRSSTARTRCGRAASACRRSSAGRPSLPAGRTLSQVAVTMDLSATFVARSRAATRPEPDSRASISCRSFAVPAPAVERTLFWRVGPAPAQARAVRSGDWKICRWRVRSSSSST